MFRPSRMLPWLVPLALFLTSGQSAHAADASSWKPRLVQLAPDGSHFLFTLCWQRVYCRPWTFHLSDRTWKRLYIKGEEAESSYDSAAYSSDQRSIVSARQLCSEGTCDYLSSQMVSISVSDGVQQTLATEHPAFMPTITRDGTYLYWALRSVTQVPSEGTTPYPPRGPMTSATHDLFLRESALPSARKVVEVSAQLPLAPPKVLDDGRSVVVAAIQIRGSVSVEGRRISPWAPPGDYSTNSAILADIKSGDMRSLASYRGPPRLLLDVGCQDSVALIGEYGVLIALDLISGTKRTVAGGTPGSARRLGTYRHAALDKTCDRALTIIGDSILLVQVNKSDSEELLALPL